MEKLETILKYAIIAIIGDSLSAGAGSSLSYETEEILFEENGIKYRRLIAPNGWGSLLEKDLQKKDNNFRVKNRGCCGAYSYQIDKFLDELVKDEDQLVLVLMGTNDRKRVDGMNELRVNCDRVIARLRNRGKDVVLLTPNPSVHSNEYRANRIYHTEEVVNILRESAKKNKVLLIDNYKYILDYLKENQLKMEDIMWEDGCTSDGLHPPDFVQKLVFENVVKELKKQVET